MACAASGRPAPRYAPIGIVLVTTELAENTALGQKPINAIRTIAGLLDTLAYLDARRAVL